MQKVNVNAHIWNELRSNDRLGFKHVSSIYLRFSGRAKRVLAVAIYYGVLWKNKEI